jgi:hypothetical protein
MNEQIFPASSALGNGCLPILYKGAGSKLSFAGCINTLLFLLQPVHHFNFVTWLFRVDGKPFICIAMLQF